MMTTRSRLLASSFLAGAALLAAAPALAQSTEPTTGNVKTTTTENNGQAAASTREVPNSGGVNAPGDAGAQVGEVVVTGSRIARRDYVADSPIVSVGPKALENTGAVTLDRLINEIPQFVPGLGGSNNNPGNGQVNIQLRGLGSTRTLILLDGRRITPSNVNGVVDINTIPQALLENVEVVTGGQSTAYGSDAIGGVVNFKLKHNFQGVVVDATYGQSDQSDGQEVGVNVTAGSNFADDRGNAVLSLGYSNREPVFYGQRANVTRADFATISPGATLDPRILAVSGLSGTRPQGGISFLAANLPSQGAINTLFTGYGVGAATAATITPGFTFGPNNDGTLFNGAANYRGPTTIDFSTITRLPTASNGGSYNTGALNYIQLPLTRYNAFGNVEYAITPHVKAYAQFTFTDYTSQTQLAPSPASGNPTGVASTVGSGGTGFLVSANNPFISADLRTLLNSRGDPNAPFVFAKRFTELGARIDQNEYTTYQSIVGVKGDVPFNDITYDVFGAYGHLNQSESQFGNVSHANAAAVFANSTANNGVCASYNPFGVSTISAACRAYLSPNTKNQTQYTQRIVEGDFQGKLFTTPDFFNGHVGGDVRFAFGADYRDDRASFSPDALLSSFDTSTNSYTRGGTTYNLVNNTTGVVGFNGSAPVSGDIDVYETYGELLVPVLKDLPFVKSISLDLGGRYSDYSTVGSIYTYKGDLEWKVFDWLLLRGGYSRATRAPNVSDLFTPATNGFYSIGAPSASSLGSGDPCDVRGAARLGRGVNAASVRALCLSQGVPASLIDTYQGANTQVQELAGGNPNLRPERSNTYTGGFVLQPKFSMPLFSHVSASVDYYNIEINGAVGTIGPSTQFSKCFNEDGTNPTYTNANLFCSLFIRDPSSGQIISGFANNQNLGAIRTSGVDFQVDWNFALSTLPYMNLSDKYGSLAFNLTATWLNDFDVQNVPGDRFLQQRDTINSTVGSALPVWKALLNTNYSVGPFDFGVVERYIGDAKDGSCIGLLTVCTARGVDPQFYTDLNGRWKINDTLELRGGITNVTNKDPRFFSIASASQGQTDASTYDLIGRRYFVALKARF